MKAGVNMAVDDKTVIQSSEMTSEKSKWKSKKMMCVAGITSLTVVLVVVAMVTGFVVMTQQHIQLNKDILESNVTVPSGEKIKTKTEVIKDEHVEIDTIIREDGQHEVILKDFNRQLLVIKRNNRCLVTPLNVTEPPSSGENKLHAYFVAPFPVEETSFLGQRGKDICDSFPVHWAHPQCISGNSDNGMQGGGNATSRAKRQADCFFCRDFRYHAATGTIEVLATYIFYPYWCITEFGWYYYTVNGWTYYECYIVYVCSLSPCT